MVLLLLFIWTVKGQFWCTNYLNWMSDTVPVCGDYASIAIQRGIADNYPCDDGLADDPSVIMFRDFENKTETMQWFSGAWFNAEEQGYGWAQNQGVGFGSAINITSTIGKHWPEEMIQWFDEDVDPSGPPGALGTDEIYVRFYRRYEPGYQMQAHKSPGVYAMCCDPQDINGAGSVPDGSDKFSTKVIVNDAGEPLLYSYHPDQEGKYGDALFQNLLTEQVHFESDVWYCVEMMLKANTPGQRDGEVALWIDGKQIMYYNNMRFRNTESLKINRPLHSMWMDQTAKFAQTVYDDQIVWATQYVGPRSECGDIATNAPTTPTAPTITDEPSSAPVHAPTLTTVEPITTVISYDCLSDTSPSMYTCEQHKSWNECSKVWMAGSCCTSCPDACSCSNTENPYDCTADISPSGYTCEQHRSWNECDNTWMIGKCCTSCPVGCDCVDMTTSTPSQTTNPPNEPTTNEPTSDKPTTNEPTTAGRTNTGHVSTIKPTHLTKDCGPKMFVVVPFVCEIIVILRL
eukprot:123857_1